MLPPIEVAFADRRVLRRAISLPVTLEPPSSPSTRARIVDLSPSGMRVQTQAALSVGATMRVTFTPPSPWTLGPIGIRARVVHCRWEARSRQASAGLVFLRAPEQITGALEEALRGLPPPLPQRHRSPRIEWVCIEARHGGDTGTQVDVPDLVSTAEIHGIELTALSNLLTGRCSTARS